MEPHVERFIVGIAIGNCAGGAVLNGGQGIGDRQREIILAEAYRDAQKIKGEGDASAARIYAQAFTRNPEFYSFYRSMEAYRNSFRNKSDVMVLEPSSDFFKYLKNPNKGGK